MNYKLTKQNSQDIEPNFCSGIGLSHTDKNGKALLSITWPEILTMVANPQDVEKPQARWLIPSTLHTRAGNEQKHNGEFWALWGDFDNDPKPIAEISRFWEQLSGGCDAVFYSSKSATAENPKSRLIVLLAMPLSGADYMIAAECLNDELRANGFTPDITTETTNQLCFLPNRGAYYDAYWLNDGIRFDPLTTFAAQIEAKRAAIVAAEVEAENQRKAAELKRQQWQASGRYSPIEEYNACNSIESIVVAAGYARRGQSFRHPNSASGSYSASVKDGRIYALSPNDPLYTGGGAHDAFSATVILFFNGNTQAALDAIREAA